MNKNNIIAIAFFLIGSGLAWLLDSSLEHLEQEEISLATQITAEQLQLRLQSCVAPRLGQISLLTRGWNSWPELESGWTRAAGAIFDISPGMQALNLVDTERVIRQVYPLAGNESALNADLDQHPNPSVSMAIARAASIGSIQSTDILDLLQSGKGFAQYLPIANADGELLGFVNAVYRTDTLINTCFSEQNLRDQYVYRIAEQNGAVFFQQPESLPGYEWQLSSSHTLTIANQPWLLELAPSAERLADIDSPLQNLWFLLAVLLVLLLAIAIRALLNNRDFLHESRSRYRLLVENQSDLIIKLDLEGVFLYVSPSYCRFMRKSESELLGTKFMATLNESEQEKAREVFLSLNENTQRGAMTQRIQIGDKLHWLEWVGSLGFNDEKVVDCIVAVGRDITEQKLMETQVAHSQKMRAVGELAGGISHDFNNLLQVILANIELLIAQPDRTDSDRRLDNIRNAVNNGIELTSQLSTISRQESGRTEVLDLSALLRESAKLISRSLPSTLDFQYYCPDEMLPVKGNKSQLQRVLLNLCFNARDAVAENGSINIELNATTLDQDFCQSYENLEPGSYVQISVMDNGTGIDEKILPRIFDPFFSTKRKDKGTGLGLANCYSLVNQHGGIIVVQSEVGLGSRFDIYLPLLIDPQQSSPPKSSPAANEQTSTSVSDRPQAKADAALRILVADDNDELLKTIESFLKLENMTVLSAHDGMDAVEKYRNMKPYPDLVILDLLMPEMNGEQAANEILALNPDARILFISGYIPDSEMAANLASKSLLRKPFTRVELMAAISRLMESGSPN